MCNILSEHHRLPAISKGEGFCETGEAEYPIRDKMATQHVLDIKSVHGSYSPADNTINDTPTKLRSVKKQAQTVIDIEQSNETDTAKSNDSDEEFYDCGTDIIEDNSNEHLLSQQKQVNNSQPNSDIIPPNDNNKDDLFYDCVTQQSYESSGDFSINSQTEILSDKDPAEQIIYNIISTVKNPESYIIDNPDLFVSLFKENKESMIDVMSNRIDMLSIEIKCWMNSKGASDKIEKINLIYNDLLESNENGYTKQETKLFKDLVKQLMDFETEFGVTPYEDICKAAVLLDTSPEIRDFFGADLLMYDLMDLVNSENPDIHKSSGYKLSNCIKMHLDNYRSFLQEKANTVLVETLKQTSFATNHGDITPEQLYHRTLKQKGGVTLVKQWIEASIREKWGTKDGSFICNKDEQLLLTELNNHAHSGEALSSWLSMDQNIERKQHLQEVLTIIYAQFSVDNIKKNIHSQLGLDYSLTEQMTLCQHCLQMLTPYKSKFSSTLQNSLYTISMELQHLAIKTVLNTGCIGLEPVCFLPRELFPENCESKPHLKNSSQVVMQHMIALINMKQRPLGDVSFSEEITLKDKLLVAQTDLLFKHAQEITGTKNSQTENTAEDDFDAICHKIEHINAQRDSLQTLKSDGSTYFERAKKIGLSAFYNKEVPVSTRLRNLRLKHNIKLDGYNYAEEKTWIYNHINGAIHDITKFGENAYHNVTVSKSNPSALLWELFNLKGNVSLCIEETLRKEFFDDFQELMKNNPRLARNLVGDISQSAAMVMQLFGGGSVIYKLFEQMEWRAWGETAQSYVNDRFDDKANDYQQLNEKQRASIKHMFALCEILKEAPKTIQAAKVGVNVVKNLATCNIGGAIYEGAKGAVEFIGVHKIQNDISVMSDAEVRTLNIALLSLNNTPAEVMICLDTLRKNADSVADMIKDQSPFNLYFRNSPLMRPFVFRFNRLSLAIKDYYNGNGNAKALALELSKVGLVSSGALGGITVTLLAGGGLAAAIGAATFSWSALGLAASVSIPSIVLSFVTAKPYGCPLFATAHALAETLMQYESLEAPASVIWSLLLKMKKNPNSELKQLEAKLTSTMTDVFQRKNPQMKEYHALATAKQTCLNVYRQHWKKLEDHDLSRASSILATVEKLQAESSEEFEQQAKKLQVKFKTWSVLQSFMHTLPADSSCWSSRLDALQLDESVKKMIGSDVSQQPYAAISVMEMLQEELRRELGIELNWQAESIINVETGKEIDLKDDAIKDHLMEYQKHMLLGDYLAGNFLPASKKLSNTRSKAEATVLKAAKQRCVAQATSTADLLIRLSISNMVLLEKNHSGQVNKEKVIRNLKNNKTLKVALKQQIAIMKTSADRCIKEQISEIRDSLQKLNIDVKKSKLREIVSTDSKWSSSAG
ncbi:MAG: hypothetical protein QS748_08245 [Candidatus Endonucleobacter bathymodioli]|uniref:Uncharacterized protein n=1 Tax=Candidatus Endonucleibacter bathymodioli TaxID=539814 RepID=A0AA90SMS6_9GAMM|nr:hypothetical protein [Candidatus Endonucleobacter bathymodioli]